MKLEMDVDVRFDEFKLAACLSLEAPLAALFGPAGAGKSTILGLIAGTVNPRKGWIRLGEDLLCDTGSGIRVPASQRRIGMVSGKLSIYPHRCARDYLEEGLHQGRGAQSSLLEMARFMEIE
mgnify:CR=1 FL=1